MTARISRWTWILAICMPIGWAAAAPSLGHRRTTFHWEASLDRPTGRAASLETSSWSTKKRNDSWTHRRAQMRSTLSSMVEEYPQWLCTPSMTLGLIHAVRTNHDNTEIRVRGIGLNLLTFGKVKRKSISSTHCTFVLPVCGGLLSSSSPSHSHRDLGHVEFTLIGGKQQNNSKAAYWRLDTRIAGNYCPWLAGSPPVSRVGKWRYLSTQSVVHAYVMWRFHRGYRSRIHRAVSAK